MVANHFTSIKIFSLENVPANNPVHRIGPSPALRSPLTRYVLFDIHTLCQNRPAGEIFWKLWMSSYYHWQMYLGHDTRFHTAIVICNIGLNPSFLSLATFLT